YLLEIDDILDTSSSILTSLWRTAYNNRSNLLGDTSFLGSCKRRQDTLCMYGIPFTFVVDDRRGWW
ncbi:hypothetical protein ACJX0J_025323, partial [Zea mays]